MRLTLFFTYVFCGFMVALAAIFYAARVANTGVEVGEGLEFVVLTGVVLGGVSLGGGRGSVSRAMMGTITLFIITNAATGPTGSRSWACATRLSTSPCACRASARAWCAASPATSGSFPNINTGCIVKFDEAGKVLGSMWDLGGVGHPMISSMREHKGYLYIGGVSNNRIGRIKVSGADGELRGAQAVVGSALVIGPSKIADFIADRVRDFFNPGEAELNVPPLEGPLKPKRRARRGDTGDGDARRRQPGARRRRRDVHGRARLVEDRCRGSGRGSRRRPRRPSCGHLTIR